MFPHSSPRRPVSGGFRVSQGNAGYNRHIANLSPQPAPPEELSLEQLERLTLEQLRHSSCVYTKKGPYVYHQILPDLPGYPQEAATQHHLAQQHGELQLSSAPMPQTIAASFPRTPAPKEPSDDGQQAATADEATVSSNAPPTLTLSPVGSALPPATEACTKAEGVSDQGPSADSFTFASPLSPRSQILTPAPTLTAAPLPPATTPAQQTPIQPPAPSQAEAAMQAQAPARQTQQAPIQPPAPTQAEAAVKAQAPAQQTPIQPPAPSQSQAARHAQALPHAIAPTPAPSQAPASPQASASPAQTQAPTTLARAHEQAPSQGQATEQEAPAQVPAPAQTQPPKQSPAHKEGPMPRQSPMQPTSVLLPVTPTPSQAWSPMPSPENEEEPTLGQSSMQPEPAKMPLPQAPAHFQAPAGVQASAQAAPIAWTSVRGCAEESPSEHVQPSVAPDDQDALPQQLQQGLSKVGQESQLDPHQQQQQRQSLTQHQAPSTPRQPQLHISQSSLQSSTDLQLSSLPGTPRSLSTAPYSNHSISYSPSQLSVPLASQPQTTDASIASSAVSVPSYPAQSHDGFHPMATRASFPSPLHPPSASRKPYAPSYGPPALHPSSPGTPPSFPPSPSALSSSTLPPPSLDLAFRSPVQSQEWSPRGRVLASRPPWNVGPGMRDPPEQAVRDEIHSNCVHFHGPKRKEKDKTVRRSRASLTSGLLTSVEHAFPPGTTLADVLAYQQVQLSQPMQQQMQLSKDRQEQLMRQAQSQDWQHEQWMRQQQQQQQQRPYPSQYPFLSQHRPMSGYTYGPTDAEERRQKRALYASRAGLARDMKLQRTSARVLKDEHARLAQEAASLERSLDSFSQGLVGPKVVQSRMKSLQSRLQHLAQSTQLVGHEALPQREIMAEGDGSSGPSASQAELLLRVLELVKQLQPEHPYEDSPPTSPSPALMKGHPAPPDSLYPTPSAVYASRPQTAPAPTHGAVHRDRIPEGWRTHANISRSNDVGAWQQVPQPYAQEPLAHLDTPKQASGASKAAAANQEKRDEQSTEQARPAEREMEQAQDVPAPPPPGSKITLNPRNRGEVSVVVPVMYSLMGSHERRKYADWQLSRPPNHGPAHEVYEAARRPVPYFEGTPERTHIRLRMSPSTPYWEKPEVLRRAEDWEEDQRQRALALQQPRFRALSEEEANEILDEEAREEEQALWLAGHRTQQLEREARAAWARKQEFQSEAALRQRDHRAARAEHRQQEQQRMQEQGAEGIHDASRGASGSDKSDGELGPVNLHSRRQHQQQLHRQLRAAGHQAGQADFGTYTQAAPLGTTASAIESPTFVGLACNRTVRDRQLAIEKTFFDLHNRKLDDVKPLEWQNADYEMEQNNRELERIIKEDIEEREVAHQAACQRQAEADTEAALQKEAVARLRKEAAAAAQSEQMDGSTERNLQEAGGTPTGRGTAAIGEERGSQLEEDEAS